MTRLVFTQALLLLGATLGGWLAGSSTMGLIAGVAVLVGRLAWIVVFAIVEVWSQWRRQGPAMIYDDVKPRPFSVIEAACLRATMVAAATLCGTHYGRPVQGLIAGVGAVCLAYAAYRLWPELFDAKGKSDDEPK